MRNEESPAAEILRHGLGPTGTNASLYSFGGDSRVKSTAMLCLSALALLLVLRSSPVRVRGSEC